MCYSDALCLVQNNVSGIMEEHPFPDLKISPSEFLDEIESRQLCSVCSKSRRYFCYTCFKALPSIADRIPRIEVSTFNCIIVVYSVPNIFTLILGIDSSCLQINEPLNLAVQSRFCVSSSSMLIAMLMP
jgi:hypothetical protein